MASKAAIKVIAQLNSVVEEIEPAPSVVLALTEQRHLVFAEPKGLPPPKFNDHQITLKEGAQPFKIRP